MVDAAATKGRWSIRVNLLYANLDLDYTILEGNLAYRLGQWRLGKAGTDTPGSFAKTWSLDGYAGARYTKIKARTTVDAAFMLGPLEKKSAREVDSSVDRVDPVVGLQAWINSVLCTIRQATAFAPDGRLAAHRGWNACACAPEDV